jgi:hypothetical protein
MAQGGEDDTDHIGWEKAWKEMGGTELIDCREHHRKMGEWGNDRWHGPLSRLQNTWGPLIKLLLSFKHPKKTVELDDAKEYQRTQWGSSDGETVVAEVLGTRTQFLKKHNDLREIYKATRTKILKDRLYEFSPVFIVFYGRQYLHIHEQIIEQRFQMDDEDFAGFTWRGKTLCIHVKHPVAHGIYGHQWTDLGKEIKRRVENGPQKAL